MVFGLEACLARLGLPVPCYGPRQRELWLGQRHAHEELADVLDDLLQLCPDFADLGSILGAQGSQSHLVQLQLVPGRGGGERPRVWATRVHEAWQ